MRTVRCTVRARPANPLAANYKPFVPASARLRELTPVPLIIGTLLGIMFGASSLYLVLKTGLTVSASIPVAVISITLFRFFAKQSGAVTSGECKGQHLAPLLRGEVA